MGDLPRSGGGAFIIPLDDLSEDPFNNYFQYLFSFAVMDKVSELYFYPKKGYFTGKIEIERCMLRDKIAGTYRIRRDGGFDFEMKDGNEKYICPWFTTSEFPLDGKKYVKGLERELKRIYKLEHLGILNSRSVLREINAGGMKILTNLSKISSLDKREGYCIELKYT